MSKNKEKRIFNPEDVKLRAYKREVDGEEKMFIEGYAAVFNKRSKLIMDWDGIYYEEIDPRAFDNILNDKERVDVIMTVNHNFDNIPVARNRKGEGTLALEVDDNGLKYTAEIADTSLGRDLFTSVKRGDIDSNSFVFSIKEDKIRYIEEEGYDLRTVLEVENLYDVSAVNFPAYPDAKIMEVDMRSIKEYEKNKKEKENENKDEGEVEREIDKMKIEILKRKH